jgi:hypothetical protein
MIPRLCLLALLLAASALSAIAAGPHPSLPAKVIPDCLGVNIHFTKPQPGEMEMLAKAGFKWVRLDLTWAATERKPGEYDFSAYDGLVAELYKHKIRALFILDYGNPLYAASGDKQPGDAKVLAEFRLTPGQPAESLSPAGTSAVQLAYRLEPGWKFGRLALKQAAQRPIPPLLPENIQTIPSSFNLWVYGDGKGCSMRVRFVDSTGQTFQSTGPRIDWKSWRAVSFSLQSTPAKMLEHWGGANDGVVHPPITWDSVFLLDNVSRGKVDGEIFLSTPTLSY